MNTEKDVSESVEKIPANYLTWRSVAEAPTVEICNAISL